jgi:FO synthase subunit 1
MGIENLHSDLTQYVTFSKNVFIPVTNVCRNACDYCGFRRSIHTEEARLMGVDEVKRILLYGKDAKEALFTCGERPEEIPEFSRLLNEIGYSTMVDYLVDLCEIAIEFGFFPHTNAGLLTYNELRRLREVNASMGLMLETTANLPAHRNSPGKDPELRLKMIEDAGRLKIPFTTGILIGIGESEEDRVDSLLAIERLHQEYGQIQEVIIQPFVPKSSTPMCDHPTPSIETMKKVVMTAREILTEEIPIQVPPNLMPMEYVRELIAHGASDVGGISQQTIDHINPECRWPSEEEIMYSLKIPLKERLPIYPRFIKKGWYTEKIGELLEKYSI